MRTSQAHGVRDGAAVRLAPPRPRICRGGRRPKGSPRAAARRRRAVRRRRLGSARPIAAVRRGTVRVPRGGGPVRPRVRRAGAVAHRSLVAGADGVCARGCAANAGLARDAVPRPARLSSPPARARLPARAQVHAAHRAAPGGDRLGARAARLPPHCHAAAQLRARRPHRGGDPACHAGEDA